MSTNNTSETVYVSPASVPANEAGTVYVPGGTAATSAGAPDGSAKPLQKGTYIDGYMIMDTVSDKGSESVVYKVMKGGSDYALKLYKRDVELSEVKMQVLMQLQCPYIAKLCGYGVHQGQPYEVYRYYKNGTLEGRGRIDSVRLKEYIRQLNEALHCLHTAQGVAGMVHGDLKPSNIFVSDDGESVLLGDFGVSNLRTAAGAQFAQICGTPEFAPPSTGVMDRMKKGPAYDYGALGLVVYYMATGYSYFSGFSADQIAVGWEQGIRIPEELDTRIKLLLKGLLQKNEEARFGYEQVFDWYRGSFVQTAAPKKIYTQEQSGSNISLWFGIFDGQIVDVTSVEELVRQMKLHWEQAAIKLRDTNLYYFLDHFYPDGSVTKKIKSFLESGDEDSAVFKTLYTLSDNAQIVYKGKVYGTASDLIEAMAAQDLDAKEMITKGLFLFYVDAMGYPAETCRTMQEILSMKNCPEAFKIRTIGYMFAEKKVYNGWTTIDELRNAVCNMSLDQIGELAAKPDFLAWLYVMGLQEQALSIITGREDV